MRVEGKLQLGAESRAPRFRMVLALKRSPRYIEGCSYSKYPKTVPGLRTANIQNHTRARSRGDCEARETWPPSPPHPPPPVAHAPGSCYLYCSLPANLSCPIPLHASHLDVAPVIALFPCISILLNLRRSDVVSALCCYELPPPRSFCNAMRF